MTVADAAAAPGAGPLSNRVILIAGAYGGLGAATAIACAKAGAETILLGRKVPKLNRVYDRIVADGGRAMLYPLDLEGASPDDYAELAQRVGRAYGRLDGLVHCAAYFTGLTPLQHTDPAALARALHVNLTARCWLTQACLPLLAAAPEAVAVFVMDDAERTGGAYWGGYGMAQQAMPALVPMLQAEIGPDASTRISGLRPGPMRTSLRARAYVEEDDTIAVEPAVYANACVRLLSPHGARYRGAVWSPDRHELHELTAERA